MTNVSISEKRPQGDYGRPASIEEPSNRYIIHPLSAIVAKAAIQFGVTANQVSVLGLFCGLTGAFFYYNQSEITFVIAGFLSMIAWHVFDGADGRIARATGTSSAFGRVIDGICDHLVFAAVYIATTTYLISAGAPLTIWILALSAGASHAVQAAAYEERRQQYQRRSKGIERQSANKTQIADTHRVSFFASGYDHVQQFVSGGGASQLDNVLDAMRANGAPDHIVQSAVNRTALVVRRWSILNANNRTVIIALTAFIGFPAAYFIIEITVFNIALIVLLIHQRRTEAAIVKDLSPIAKDYQ